jgi:hypothetical protein
MKEAPAILDSIADRVLAYRPKKTKGQSSKKDRMTNAKKRLPKKV